MKKHCRIELDEYEQGIMLNALTLLRNQQLRDGRPTDPVNDLIEKILCAENDFIFMIIYSTFINIFFIL